MTALEMLPPVAPRSVGPRVGYVVKRYPRFSETFIVNEILAHEADGLDIEIFSLRPCNDTHFQDRIARVRAPLTQLNGGVPKATAFWEQLKQLATHRPHLWRVLSEERYADVTSIQQAATLSQLIVDRGITHLHAHFATLPATVARLAAAISGVPYTLTAHAKDIFHESVIPGDLREKLLDAVAVVTVSQFNAAHLKEQFGLRDNRLHCVYNGLDLDELPFGNTQEAARQILAVGRLVEKKGFADLIRACAHLRSRDVDFACTIVGGGDQESALNAMIGNFDLQDVVRLLGPMPQSEVKRLLQSSAVMAAPCVVAKDGNRDGLPTVLLEAMAMGTPCVSTPVTGIPEVIRHERTGWIVPENDAESLSWALERLLDDSTLRSQLALAARTLIEQRFDARVTSAKIRELFRSSPCEAQLPTARLQEQF